MSNKPQRISKWLVHLGYVETRREAERFLDEHTVVCGGEELANPDAKVLPEAITIDGEPMDAARLVVMLNKPAGYVCSHDDPGLRVYDLLPDRFRVRTPKLISVGRLDKDTTGLLLLTDDGMLSHKLTHPRQHVEKCYEVTLEKPLRGHEVELFAAGTLKLEGEEDALRPATLEVMDETHARLILHEGKFHQVKRMFAAAGNHVVALHRSRIGALALGDLPEGQWRFITPEEEALLIRV